MYELITMPNVRTTADVGLLTVNQAAAYLSVPIASIAWLCRTKQLAYAVVAGKRRFRKEDLDDYVRERLVKAVP